MSGSVEGVQTILKPQTLNPPQALSRLEALKTSFFLQSPRQALSNQESVDQFISGVTPNLAGTALRLQGLSKVKSTLQPAF